MFLQTIFYIFLNSETHQFFFRISSEILQETYIILFFSR